MLEVVVRRRDNALLLAHMFVGQHGYKVPLTQQPPMI